MKKAQVEVIIRLIETKDNKALQTIIQNSLREAELDKPGTAYFDPYLGNLSEYYSTRSNSAYWVAADKKTNTVVGGIGISYFGDYKDIAELQKYYVQKEYQNRGIGSLLFQQAINFAQEKMYKAIYIETMDVLEKANSVYEHFGFEPLDRPLDGSEHGLMNRWYMKKI